MSRLENENRYNYYLLGLVFLLLCAGLVMVYSASHPVALKRYDDSSLFFRNHFYRVFFGIGIMILTALIPYKFWLRYAKLGLLVGIILLILVLFIGTSKEGAATRWLRLFGMRFQPVDFVRLALILYLTDAMVRKHDYLDHWKEGFLPQIIVLGIVELLLMKQPDMGSVVILCVLACVIFLTAGVRVKYLCLVGAVILPALLLKQPYQINRVTAFINSVFNGHPLVYQIDQSFISLGNGGFWGVGLDNSTQKLAYLPAPFTDFIFAIVGEEFGFLGAMIILTLFLLLVIEGYRIAHRCQDEAGMILATGITTSIALYAFLNAGVVCNLFPTKGLPMPFISYGGSFMISTLAGIGLLLNISQYNAFRLAGGDRPRNLFTQPQIDFNEEFLDHTEAN